MKQKKIPMRMCIGCHESKPKKELLRIVKVAQKLLDEGRVSESICIDRTGKLSGRGAYICPNIECLKSARKTKRLEREFETSVESTVYESLEVQMGEINGTGG